MAKVERGAAIDWGGFVAFTVFILSLLLALTVAAYGVSEAATIAGLLVLSAAGLSAFVFLERRHPHPLLDLKLLRIREFTGGLLAQMLNAIAFGAVLLLLSLYFQLVLDKKPLEAGLLIIPTDIATLAAGRSEERRVGEEWRSRWSPDPLKKKKDFSLPSGSESVQSIKKLVAHTSRPSYHVLAPKIELSDTQTLPLKRGTE